MMTCGHKMRECGVCGKLIDYNVIPSAEERAAWDMYASAMLDSGISPAMAVGVANTMLTERRKLFGGTP